MGLAARLGQRLQGLQGARHQLQTLEAPSRSQCVGCRVP